MLHDVTALKQAEAELQQKTDETAKMAEEIARLFEEEQTQRKMAESLRQTAVALNSSLDYQIVVRKILSLVRDVVNYDSVGLFLQMEDKLVLTDGVALDTLIFGYQIALNSPNRTAIVFNRRSPDIVDDVRTDPYWEALPPFGDKIRSWMAVPLLLGNRAIGVVTVDSYTTNVYEQRDAQVLQIFANQAAVAVENTRLHRQAQTAAALEERNRLAQDLHDAVNQTLFSAGLIAEAVPDIWEEDPEQGRLGLQELRVLTQSALAEMRSLLLELRPTSLTNKNLGELMTYLIRAVTARTRIPIELTVEADNRLPPEVQVTVYRIAQEAFNNISKHAKADQIAVTLNCRADEMTLSIGDNGCGFNPDALTVGHLGLGIMRERAKSVNARLEIISRPGAGTRIILTWQENDKK